MGGESERRSASSTPAERVGCEETSKFRRAPQRKETKPRRASPFGGERGPADELNASVAQLSLESEREAAPARRDARTRAKARVWQDTVETLKQAYFQGYPESAGCVQGSIDSRNSAIHSAYRISLRPSSLFEPRHPSLKVVRGFTELRTLAESPSRVRSFTVPRGRYGSVNADSRGISVQGVTTIAST